MGVSTVYVALVVTSCLTLCQGQSQVHDATRIAGESGSNVVNAVIDTIHSKGILSQDRLFLRRVAHAMSEDGNASHTYQPGSGGGLWKVSNTMFEATKACNNILITKACDIISSELGIQWTTVAYSELNKPLYSGLAAALYTLLQMNGQPMPANISSQALKWQIMYGETSSQTFLRSANLFKAVRRRRSASVPNTMTVAIEGGGLTGRLIATLNGQEGTVCDDAATNDLAAVVCRQLGYITTQARIIPITTPTNLPIIMDDVSCTGSESTLADCTYITVHNCQHSEDIGVECPPPPVPDTMTVAIEGGGLTGRLIATLNGQEGTVCDDAATNDLAVVVCRQLGYITTQARIIPITTPTNLPIIMDDVSCTGSESTLADCTYITVHNCQHSEDIGVECPPPPVPDTMTVAIEGGGLTGRLIATLNGQEGTVCDDAATNDLAVVVCRQLGYITTQARIIPITTPTNLPIIMDDVSCTGSESTLADCTYITVHNCQHSEDIGVECPPPPVPDTMTVAIEGGGLTGRLIATLNGQEGTVCDDAATNDLAAVVCRQLGYNTTQARIIPITTPTNLPIIMDDVSCTGSESTLADCTYITVHNCQHSEDIGVECPPPPVPDTMTVAIEGGGLTGRLIATLNGQEGTVCDDAATNDLAVVVCRQLGYITTQARIIPITTPTNLPIIMDDVSCTGSESTLADCTYITVHNCQHSEDIGVECPPPPVPDTMTVAIEGGGLTGRLIATLNGQEGTVCDDAATNDLAVVVCRQLGYITTQARIIPITTPTNLPIIMDDVSCTGSESTLADCTYITVHNCQHSEDIGVECPPPPVPDTMTVAIEGGGLTGRLIATLNGQEGTVCDDAATNDLAAVVCRQLGYNTTQARIIPITTPTNLPIIMDDVSCTGSESTLADCTYITVHNCQHSEDIGVECPPPPVPDTVTVAIEGGGHTGRLIATLNGQEGTVCDDAATNDLAAVVCRQLGYNTTQARIIPVTTPTNLPIIMDDVSCTGSESTLADCTYITVHNCQHSEDVGVECPHRDPCDASPCQNGGQCTGTGATTFTCQCTADYSGDRCETYVDPCGSSPSPCQNGGGCTRVDASTFTCQCTADYTGDRCQTYIDPCDPSPCQNGGTCTRVDASTFTCQCTADYTGEECQTHIDPCDPSPCQNGGTCTRVDASTFTCQCTADYNGDKCQTYIDRCGTSPCQNGGQCTRVDASTFTCQCTAGYTGDMCQTPVANACAPNPCQNGGQCTAVSSTDFNCQCTADYTGDVCDILIDPCDSLPCQNNGTCVRNSVSTFECLCFPGTNGTLCEISDICWLGYHNVLTTFTGENGVVSVPCTYDVVDMRCRDFTVKASATSASECQTSKCFKDNVAYVLAAATVTIQSAQVTWEGSLDYTNFQLTHTVTGDGSLVTLDHDPSANRTVLATSDNVLSVTLSHDTGFRLMCSDFESSEEYPSYLCGSGTSGGVTIQSTTNDLNLPNTFSTLAYEIMMNPNIEQQGSCKKTSGILQNQCDKPVEAVHLCNRCFREKLGKTKLSCLNSCLVGKGQCRKTP